MIKNKYDIAKEEKEKIIRNYFKRDGEQGKLNTIPSSEKRKVIVFEYIMENFESGKQYTYKEVNQILKEICNDYVTIRRYLIDYGFMERAKDCKLYWVKE